MTYLLLLGFVAAVIVGYVALRNAQDFSDANEIVPGVPTNAPKAWAGAHSPEARMHRRLRDAVLALQANASLDAPDIASVRTSIEQQALAVDERLIAAAALAKSRREEPLLQVERAVQAIEGAVADVVALRGPSMGSIEQGLEDVRARLRHVQEAHDELQGMTPGSATFDAIRAHIEQTTSDPPSEPPSGPPSGPDADDDTEAGIDDGTDPPT